MIVKVIKKDGRRESFDFQKIKDAVNKTLKRCGKEFVQEDWSTLHTLVLAIFNHDPKAYRLISVEELHLVVMEALKVVDEQVYQEYSAFRGYKQSFNKVMKAMMNEADGLLYIGDKENANRDSQLIDAKKSMMGEILSYHLSMNFEIPKRIATAHMNNNIYIHDTRDFAFDSINCCLFDMGEVLKGGYEYNGIQYAEPNSILVAGEQLQDIMNTARLQQFGGFTIPEIDKVLAPYVRKTFVKYYEMFQDPDMDVDPYKFVMELTMKDVRQVFQSIEHSLNMVNNTFVTFSFGMETSKWGRMVSQAILQVRATGLGTKGVPAIFPKLVFLHEQRTNGDTLSPNYDLKELAVQCSMKSMYPDFLSLDKGYLNDMWVQHGAIVSPMGCRAYLSPYYKDGDVVFTGRANCGAVSLNLPSYAIEAEGNIQNYLKSLEENFWLAIDLHLYKYSRLRTQKASSNPLFFTQGGCHIKLGMEDTIEEAIKTFTWSIGYIGLEEVTYAMRGCSLVEDTSIAHLTLDTLNKLIDEAKKKHGLMFALYATPAESLCFKWAEAGRDMYGVIEGVTDKKYYTNSFHVDVRNPIYLDKKMEIESEFFHKSTGGRISYTEFPTTNNYYAMIQSVNYAMKLGLYYGINLQLDTCNDCGHQAEFTEGKCTKCHSPNVLRINRICGYLGYTSINGDTRVNGGKQEEIDFRVKHTDL